jgi:hypothetical protein
MTFYDLNMNSKRITSCQDPSGNQDVATKNYVDTRLPIIVSTPTTGFSILNSTLPTNTETNVTSVTATIVASGVYRVTGSLCVQSNANGLTYGSLYCSTQSTPLPAPGPARVAVVTILSYNQAFATINTNIHKQLQGTTVVTGTQLGGTGTITIYLIGAFQTQTGVAQGPDGNGLSNVFLLIERIA